MDERRRFPRLAIDVEVSWRKIKESDTASDLNINNTKNISEGGICLVSYEPLEKGENLSLEFALPSGKRINAVGCVAWVDDFEVNDEQRCDAGIEFVDISAEDRQEIQKFVFSISK